jgi:hypothetical protein
VLKFSEDNRILKVETLDLISLIDVPNVERLALSYIHKTLMNVIIVKNS